MAKAYRAHVPAHTMEEEWRCVPRGGSEGEKGWLDEESDKEENDHRIKPPHKQHHHFFTLQSKFPLGF